MIDYTAWLDRINNLLTVQKELSLDKINMVLTRREAIELRQMVETLKELENIRLMEDLPQGTEIKSANTKEWHELRNELEEEGYELEFMPGMVIKVKGRKEK